MVSPIRYPDAKKGEAECKKRQDRVVAKPGPEEPGRPALNFICHIYQIDQLDAILNPQTVHVRVADGHSIKVARVSVSPDHNGIVFLQICQTQS